MTTEQFTYWLQGFAEINTQAPTDEQWTVIKDNLALVFEKKTPNRGIPNQITQPYTAPYINDWKIPNVVQCTTN